MSFCLIDFEDSFTYNIVSEFKKFDITVDVYHWSLLDNDLISKYQFFVLGPGPGFVEDYTEVMPTIDKLLFDEKNFLFGVCLGHQLIHHSYGAKIVPWKKPLHGQAKEIAFPYWLNEIETNVQFYNSWGVDPSFDHDELELFIYENKVIATKGKNFISYQFHPESVGTTCPETFFNPVLEIYYNSNDGLSFQNRRHLRSQDFTLTRSK